MLSQSNFKFRDKCIKDNSCINLVDGITLKLSDPENAVKTHNVNILH